MHDRNFLRDRVSSTCEPGLRHTREVDSHYWAAQGCPLGRIPTFPSASLLFYARRSYTSACTHDATKFSYASLLHYVVAYNRRMHRSVALSFHTCATVCNAGKPMLLRSFRFSLVFETCRERAPFIGPVKVIQAVSMILFIFFLSRDERKIKTWYLNINELFLAFFSFLFLNFFPRL